MTEFLLINVVLLAMLVWTAIATVRSESLLSAAMLASIYSFLMALVWTNLDSMDVAFTEAAVGAGISTVLLIGTLVHVGTKEKMPKGVHWPALAVVTLTGALLIYGSLDMPPFGDANTPVQTNPVPHSYIRQDVVRVSDGNPAHDEAPAHADYYHGHVPNYVTPIIVSYRGFDTMFETTVIFLAGMGMILLLRRKRGVA